MNAEASREPERHWKCWMIPKGLGYSAAMEIFNLIKPLNYTYETFRYDKDTGVVRTF